MLAILHNETGEDIGVTLQLRGCEKPPGVISYGGMVFTLSEELQEYPFEEVMRNYNRTTYLFLTDAERLEDRS